MNGMERFGRIVCTLLVLGAVIACDYLAARDIASGTVVFGPLGALHVITVVACVLLWGIWAKKEPGQ